jgi:hypothetical protein
LLERIIILILTIISLLFYSGCYSNQIIHHGCQYAGETVNMNAPNIDLINTQIIAGEVDIEAERLRILTRQSQSEGYQTSVGAGANFSGPDSFHAAHQEHESRQAPLQPGIRARSGRVNARSAHLQGAFIDIEDGEFAVEDLTFEEVKNFVNEWGFSLGLSGMQSAIHGTDDSGIAGDFDFGFDRVDRQQVNRPTVSERTRLISNCNIRGLNRCILNAQETIRDRQVHMRIWVPLRVDTQKVANNLNEMGNYIAEALATCKKIEAEADDPAIRQAAKDLAESMESAKKDKPDADDDEIAEDVNRAQRMKESLEHAKNQQQENESNPDGETKNEQPETEPRTTATLDPEGNGIAIDLTNGPAISPVTPEQLTLAEDFVIEKTRQLTGRHLSRQEVRGLFGVNKQTQSTYNTFLSVLYEGGRDGASPTETNLAKDALIHLLGPVIISVRNNPSLINFDKAVLSPNDVALLHHCTAPVVRVVGGVLINPESREALMTAIRSLAKSGAACITLAMVKDKIVSIAGTVVNAAKSAGGAVKDTAKSVVDSVFGGSESQPSSDESTQSEIHNDDLRGAQPGRNRGENPGLTRMDAPGRVRGTGGMADSPNNEDDKPAVVDNRRPMAAAPGAPMPGGDDDGNDFNQDRGPRHTVEHPRNTGRHNGRSVPKSGGKQSSSSQGSGNSSSTNARVPRSGGDAKNGNQSSKIDPKKEYTGYERYNEFEPVQNEHYQTQQPRSTLTPKEARCNIAKEHYKADLRTPSGRPHIKDSALRERIEYYHKTETNCTGSGSTASAHRSEQMTGQKVGDKWHGQKTGQGIKELTDWLAENPRACPSDRAAATNMLKDLKQASTTPKGF